MSDFHLSMSAHQRQRRHLLHAGVALLTIGPVAAFAESGSPRRGGQVLPLLHAPDAQIPLELAQVRIHTEVVGLAAQTRIELQVFNPNRQDLEGALQFPLQDGQVVTGFALEVDSELRPAVPVEKAKGRQVFEDVTRTRIDPALLESTGSNSYRLRIYPLPARGLRRVVLEITETLVRQHTGVQESALLQLPLQLGMSVQELEVTVRIPRGASGTVPQALFAGQVLPLVSAPGSWLVRLVRSNYTGTAGLRVAVPLGTEAPEVITQSLQDDTYFYAEVPLALQTRQRSVPGRVALLWDASASASQRDQVRELALLDAFFGALGNVAVDLLVVRDAPEPLQRFNVVKGRWQDLRDRLRSLPQDGATRLDRMTVPAGADLALLFSDGQGSWGDGGLPAAQIPLYTFISGPGVDANVLRRAAEHTGGVLVDLMRTAVPEAVALLRRQHTRLLSADGVGIEDVVVESRLPQKGRLVVAGRLREPGARLVLRVQAPNGTVSQRSIDLPTPMVTHSKGLPIAAQRWAILRLGDLEAQGETQRQAVRRLGMRFGLVTRGTSLIVLDRVEDYVQHGIEPPSSLLAAYQRLLARRTQREQADRQSHLNRVAERFAAKQAWWEREFPKDIPPLPKVPDDSIAESVHQRLLERQRADEPQRPRPNGVMRSPPPAPVAMPAPPPALVAPAAPPDRVNGSPPQQTPAISIALRRWTPDALYARRLRETTAEQMYAVYLDERPGHINSTAFFLDAAELFFERGQQDLALRILSNLAEMALENRHVLRLIAYRLLQAQQLELAIPLLRQVLALSPDEPQSSRDLGLALARQGHTQAAVDRLWDVVSRPWNNRFSDIELVALAELNAIVAAAQTVGQSQVDTGAIDPRLLRNLPLDLRVVLSWDSDNTDIDLYVIDPDGQEAYYGRQLTRQGGLMSRDFTGGYGPEEFSLRKAKPGTYTVRAEFFGHRQQVVSPTTALMLRLSTGFGTPQQKDVDTVLRLSGGARRVTIGTFDVRGML